MGTISRRNYTTKQRDTYSFEANWELSHDIVSWRAQIWRGVLMVGTQSGTFRDSPSQNVEDLVASRVRANLEAGIENFRAVPP